MNELKIGYRIVTKELNENEQPDKGQLLIVPFVIITILTLGFFVLGRIL